MSFILANSVYHAKCIFNFLNDDDLTISDFVMNVQRFYEHGGEMQVAQDAPLRPSMDVFAVG